MNAAGGGISPDYLKHVILFEKATAVDLPGIDDASVPGNNKENCTNGSEY